MRNGVLENLGAWKLFMQKCTRGTVQNLRKSSWPKLFASMEFNRDALSCIRITAHR